jgi:hypothetical protein
MVAREYREIETSATDTGSPRPDLKFDSWAFHFIGLFVVPLVPRDGLGKSDRIIFFRSPLAFCLLPGCGMPRLWAWKLRIFEWHCCKRLCKWRWLESTLSTTFDRPFPSSYITSPKISYNRIQARKDDCMKVNYPERIEDTVYELLDRSGVPTSWWWAAMRGLKDSK